MIKWPTKDWTLTLHWQYYSHFVSWEDFRNMTRFFLLLSTELFYSLFFFNIFFLFLALLFRVYLVIEFQWNVNDMCIKPILCYCCYKIYLDFIQWKSAQYHHSGIKKGTCTLCDHSNKQLNPVRSLLSFLNRNILFWCRVVLTPVFSLTHNMGIVVKVNYNNIANATAAL